MTKEELLARMARSMEAEGVDFKRMEKIMLNKLKEK